MKASCRAASLLAAGGWAWDFGIHLSLPHSVGDGVLDVPDGYIYLSGNRRQLCRISGFAIKFLYAIYG